MENNEIGGVRPVESSAPVSTPAEAVKVKKKANIPAIVFGVTTLIFAGFATFFGIKFFTDKPVEEVEEFSEIKEEDIESIPETVVETITINAMAEEYKEVKDMMDALKDSVGETSVASVEHGLYYKPDGLNVYVPMKLGLVVNFWGSDRVDALKNKMGEFGFSSIGILPHGGSAGPEIQGYFNSSKGIVCGIYENSLNCSKTSWSWLTEAEKNLINELAEAYKEKRGDYPVVIGDNFRIADSSYEPYQNLYVSVGGGVGLFYRTNKDAKWQFFIGTQGVLGCDEYDTDDLRKAFAGTICYDGVTDSVVEP